LVARRIEIDDSSQVLEPWSGVSRPDPSQWHVEPASSESLEEVATWRYEPPYDFYNDDGRPVRNPERFFAVRDDGGRLVGSLLFEERPAGVFYGLGMRPDLTGRGLGLEFVRLGLAFAHERFPGRRVVLDVADFNHRARKVYERAGFRVIGSHIKHFEDWGDITLVDMEERTP
jgi:RimJ/RimL family protein N-acetyltransferase